MKKCYISRANKIAYLNILLEIGVEAFAKKYPKIVSKTSHVTALADFAMSAWVLSEETFCSCCGSPHDLQNGHLFTREWKAIRWERDNCAAQCAGCNLKHEHNPEPYRRVMVLRHGEDRVRQLHDIGIEGSNFKPKDRLEIAADRWKRYLGTDNNLTIIGRRS